LVSYEPRVEFGSVVQDRVREITLTADKFIKAGVPPRNIFLTGISFGAWSSLQAAAASKNKFNAVIVFAPGVYGTYPRGTEAQAELEGQMEVLKAAPWVHGLVFAHEKDDHINSKALSFINKMPHLKLVSLPNKKQTMPCTNFHRFAFEWCMEPFREDIIKYIAERTK